MINDYIKKSRFTVVLCLIVLLVMTSCKGSDLNDVNETIIDDNGNIIYIDSEFYNEPETFYTTSRFELDSSTFDGFNNCQSKILASDSEGYIWDMNLQNYSYDSNGSFYINSNIERICKYSYAGNLLSCVDIDIINDLGYKSFAVGSKVFLTSQSYNYETYDYDITLYQVDFENNTLKEEMGSGLAKVLSDSSTTVVDSFQWGDKNVVLVYSTNTGLTLVYVNDDLSYERKIIGDEIYRKHSISDVNALVYPITDTELLITDSNYNKFVIYNCDTKEFNDIEVDSSMTTGKYKYSSINSRLYLIDSYGIGIYNLDNNNVDRLVSFNSCNINNYEVRNLIPVNETDGVIALSTPIFSLKQDSNRNLLYIFEPTETNPNEGKTVISVVDMKGDLSPFIAAAVYEFNESHNDCVIKITDKYALNNYVSLTGNYGVSVENTEAEQLVSDQLLMDLLSGDGPDIILNGYKYSQFNTDTCLIKLNDYSSGMTTNNYFEPIISGDIYQMPLRIGLNGMMYYSNKNTLNIQNGYSYSDYETLLNETNNNGFDPLTKAYAREDYFVFLFNYMNDQFIKDGTFDIDNDLFRELAEYCSTLPTNPKKVDASYVDEYGVYSVEYVFECRYEPNMTFEGYGNVFGFPSGDGRGPAISILESAAITTSCDEVDYAWEFIEFLTSYDIQDEYAGVTSINKNVFYKSANDYITAENNRRQSNGEGYLLLSYDSVDAWLESTESAIMVHDVDPAITKILYEEIQPYFAGDKSIEEVIPIIEDRCNTVLSER